MNKAGPNTRWPERRSCSARAEIAFAISQVRAEPIAGHTAGSMQWVGQIHPAKETKRVPSDPTRS